VQAVNKSLKKSQKGAAIVETALVLITMVSMIFFVLDMGRMLLTQQFIAERARVTARMAAVKQLDRDRGGELLVLQHHHDTGTCKRRAAGRLPGPGSFEGRVFHRWDFRNRGLPAQGDGERSSRAYVDTFHAE
jgi:hypothetical protein